MSETGTPSPDGVGTAASPRLTPWPGALFIAAGLLELGLALLPDDVTLLAITLAAHGLAMGAAFFTLVGCGYPDDSTGNRRLGYVLAAAWVLQGLAPLPLARFGVLAAIFLFGLAALVLGFLFGYRTSRNPEIPRLTRPLPLVIVFGGWLLSQFGPVGNLLSGAVIAAAGVLFVVAWRRESSTIA